MHSNILYKWLHVYGHQDSVVGHVLTVPELLNVRMDLEAKSARERIENTPQLRDWETVIPYEGWIVLLDGKK